MHDLTPILSTMTASFLGSFVEVVEAFTIILAVGVTQSWRPALIGRRSCARRFWRPSCWRSVRCLALIPIELMQFVIGDAARFCLACAGCARRSCAASGFIALHDEDEAFAEETAALQQQANRRAPRQLPGRALRLSRRCCSKGIEVVFIVIATGAATRA